MDCDGRFIMQKTMDLLTKHREEIDAMALPFRSTHKNPCPSKSTFLLTIHNQKLI